MPIISNKEINLFDGILQGVIEFKEGLNLISGENGTCKTHLLKELKGPASELHQMRQNEAVNIYAISPKRNSARTAIEQVLRQINSNDHSFRERLQKDISRTIEDSTFQDFPSITELFSIQYDELAKKGEKPNPEYANEVIDNFNTVINKVFSNYELKCTWDSNAGHPKVEMSKNGTNVPLGKISCGEQEMFSLMLNLYTNRNKYDIFLIDEPEVHLNWNLEEKLFSFMREFAEQNKKQLIVTTHSRIVFKEDYLSLTQFLAWIDGTIKCLKEPPEETRDRIAGESIVLLKPSDPKITTFFVEDLSHKMFIRDLAELIDVKVSIIEADDKRNVKTIFKLAKEENWRNSFFVIDGDNEGNPFPHIDTFIHLEKYCIENYLLDIDAMQKVLNLSLEEVQNRLFNGIKASQEDIFKNGKNKFFRFLINKIEPNHLIQERIDELDGSIILKSILADPEAPKLEEYRKSVLEFLLKNKPDGLPMQIFQVLKSCKDNKTEETPRKDDAAARELRPTAPAQNLLNSVS